MARLGVGMGGLYPAVSFLYVSLSSNVDQMYLFRVGWERRNDTDIASSYTTGPVDSESLDYLPP